MSNVDVLRNVLSGAGIEALDGIEILHPNGRSIVTRLGLRVSLKFQDGHTIARRKAGLQLMLSIYETFKDHLTHWLPATGGAKKKISLGEVPPLEQPEALADVEEWYGSHLYGYKVGQKPGEPAPFLAHLSCKWDKEYQENSLFEAHIPLSWVVTHGFERVRELVRDWAARLDAVHGTAGLSLLFNDGDGSSYLKYSYFLLKKFPGIDYENSAQFSVEVNWPHPNPFMIRTISWLTVLGNKIMDELGGHAKMSAELGPDCPLFDYPTGAIIQAMAIPELGSSEDGIVPEGYRRVASLTKLVRFEGYAQGLFENLPPPMDDLQETLEWLRRFD
jgi:hypothetical protein